MKVVFFIICALILIGCTFIGFNKGNVTTTADDSHDAVGTNTARTFDINISPR